MSSQMWKLSGKFSLQKILPFSMTLSIANILFYIYDGRMFVTNTNTIKKNIFGISAAWKPPQVLIVPTVFL